MPGISRSSGGASTTVLNGLLSSVAFGTPAILLMGDSTCSQIDTPTPLATGSSAMSMSRYLRPFGWIDAYTGGGLGYETTFDIADNLRKGSNAAVGGASFPEMNTRFMVGDAYSGNKPLKDRPEKLLWVQCGTNDLNSGMTLATMITNVTTFITNVLASGKIPIMTTVLPRNSTDGAFDWNNTSGGTTTATKRLVLAAYNKWLVAFCRNLGVPCVSWHHVFSDPTTGQAITGYTVEGLHPNNRGSWYLAQEALRQVGYLFPKSMRGQQNYYDVFDATYNPYGNALNGRMSGTGGVFANAGGTGTVTGTLPDNYQLNKNVASTTSCVASIVTRNGAQAIKLVFTSTGGGSASEDWRLSWYNAASTSLASFANADDILGMEAEFDIEAGHGGVLLTPQLRVANNSAIVIGPKTTVTFDATTNTIVDSAAGFGTFLPDRAISIAGSANNNRVFKVTGVTASTLTISPSTPVTNEVAGASVTLRLPTLSMVTNSSTEKSPDVNTGPHWHRIPLFKVPTTGNLTPRVSIFINGTIAGTATIYVSRLALFKRPLSPSVLQYTATDS